MKLDDRNMCCRFKTLVLIYVAILDRQPSWEDEVMLISHLQERYHV